jgi:hypothetical protein
MATTKPRPSRPYTTKPRELEPRGRRSLADKDKPLLSGATKDDPLVSVQILKVRLSVWKELAEAAAERKWHRSVYVRDLFDQWIERRRTGKKRTGKAATGKKPTDEKEAA